jgi:hypothetical protein
MRHCAFAAFFLIYGLPLSNFTYGSTSAVAVVLWQAIRGPIKKNND